MSYIQISCCRVSVDHREYGLDTKVAIKDFWQLKPLYKGSIFFPLNRKTIHFLHGEQAWYVLLWKKNAVFQMVAIITTCRCWQVEREAGITNTIKTGVYSLLLTSSRCLASEVSTSPRRTFCFLLPPVSPLIKFSWFYSHIYLLFIFPIFNKKLLPFYSFVLHFSFPILCIYFVFFWSLCGRMYNLSLRGDFDVRACHNNLVFNWLGNRKPV